MEGGWYCSHAVYPWPFEQGVVPHVSLDDVEFGILDSVGHVDWKGDFPFCCFARHVESVEDSRGGYDLVKQSELLYHPRSVNVG